MKYKSLGVLTVKDTAKILNLTPNRINKMLRQKKKHFPNAFMPGRDWLIPYSDVLNYLNHKMQIL